MSMTAEAATNQTLTRPKQTAEHFQISIMTLHRWRKQKDFPQPLKRGAVVLYNCPAISAWLNGES
jgi:predicted DNA-binding transcriptional regulator AlpA